MLSRPFLVLAAIGAASLSTPALADPWTYLGNYDGPDGINPLLIDEGSIATEGAVTTAVVQVNIAVPDPSFADGKGAIVRYPVEMDCKARLFRYARYDYLAASGGEPLFGERFFGRLQPGEELDESEPVDKRIFDYACKIDRKGAKKVGAYDHATIKARYGGAAKVKADEDEDEDDYWDY